MSRKILFVAMQMSQHTVRWIRQIADQGWDLHLFPVNYLPVHHEMPGITVHQPWQTIRPRLFLKTLRSDPWRLLRSSTPPISLRPHGVLERAIYPLPILSPFAPYLNGIKRVRLGESEAVAPLAYGPHVLARLIRTLKPDLIHSLEFQHCGYNVLRAKELIGDGFPPWLATNWGSDIYYYRQFENHRRQISRLLGNVDYYSCECVRDIELAQELGLSGRVMPVMPNSGGLDLGVVGPMRQMHQPSRRRLIMVKGYQHFVGLALTALEAVERCAPILHDFNILVFSASPPVVKRVEELRVSLGLNISVLPHSGHDTMLRMFSRARIYLGISLSDAISTSMLEALAMGAFPIQTSTACCDEWIEDGESGFIVPPEAPEIIADRLRRAITDDALVDHAAEINWRTVRERLDQNILKGKAIAFYEEIFAGLNGSASATST
ncbi:MAG: glycosyltransferase family 4 protein [Thiobacillus sp.]|nr:glycosyltransferase family 4 protein [Thiobacillus sp.]